MKGIRLIALLLIVFVPTAARADVLVLKNGQTVRGVVRKVGEKHVVMDVYMGGDVISTTFRIDEIRDVLKEDEADREKIEAERVAEEKMQAKSRAKAYWDNKLKSIFKKKKELPAPPPAKEGKKKKSEIDDGRQDFIHDTVELMTLGTSTKQVDRTRKNLDKIEKLRKQDRKTSSTPFRVR